jgi:hypothetical protein
MKPGVWLSRPVKGSAMSHLTKRLIVFSVLLFSASMLALSPTAAQNPPILDEDAATDREERVIQYPNAEEKLEEQTRTERSQALDRRAGEQIGEDAQGRAVMLGMYVQESDSERLKVIEAAPATPAFEAGIREGDEVISFDGFKADTYREWIDGIRRLVNDAPEGDTLPVQVMRDGKLLNLRLRKPVARADDIQLETRRTLRQQVVQPGQQPIPIPGQPTQPAAGGGGVGVALGGDFFGGQFGDFATTTPNQVAVAELFTVLHGAQQSDVATATGGPPQRTAATEGFQATDANTIAQQNARSGLGTTRVGLAAFRDAQNGLLVMVDVGGLPPGNYLVGIGDVGMLRGGNFGAGTSFAPGGTTATPAQRLQSETGRPAASDQGVDPRIPRDIPTIGSPPSGQPPVNRGTVPANRPRSRRGAAGLQGRSDTLHVPPTVLAQVVDSGDASAGAGGNVGAAPVQSATPAIPATPNAPAAGGTGPLDTPGTNPNDLTGPPPIGRTPPVQGAQAGRGTDTNAAQDQGFDTQDPGFGDLSTGPTTTGLGPTIHVGTLSVDQSGAGRLQQVVDGVQVQNVVGQTIVIYSQNAATNAALPADRNLSGVPGAPTNAPGVPTAARQPTDASGDPRVVPPGLNRGAPPRTATPQPAAAGPVAVAAGVIRLLSDLNTAGTDTTDATQQPAASLPLPEQGLR